MFPTRLQHHAIEARLAQMMGAEDFDRICGGLQIGRVQGRTLDVFLPTEAMARAFEADCRMEMTVVASQILRVAIDRVAVFPDRHAAGLPALPSSFDAP